MQFKVAQASRTRRAASDLTQTLRTLAAAPTHFSVQQTQPSLQATSSASPAIAEPPAECQGVIEPERLSIGTGFAGSI